MKVNVDEIGGEVVKDNETYILKDNNELGNLTLSKTILNPFKQTRGHSHETQEEVYFFHGDGKMVLGEEEFDVKSGDIVLIPKDTFHQVKNPYEKELSFVCVFEKYSRDGEIAKYK